MIKITTLLFALHTALFSDLFRKELLQITIESDSIEQNNLPISVAVDQFEKVNIQEIRLVEIEGVC